MMGNDRRRETDNLHFAKKTNEAFSKKKKILFILALMKHDSRDVSVDAVSATQTGSVRYC